MPAPVGGHLMKGSGGIPMNPRDGYVVP